MLVRNILWSDTFKHMFYEHSQFSLFTVVIFFKVTMNTELVNMELLCLEQIQN